MFSRRMVLALCRRIVAVAPLLMMIVALPGQLMLRCRMDGTLRPACCCPAEDAAATTAQPAARPADCCDPELTDSDRLPAEKTGPTSPVGLHSAIALGAPLGEVPRVCPIAAALDRPDPMRDGPPIVLLKHAFLI